MKDVELPNPEIPPSPGGMKPWTTRELQEVADQARAFRLRQIAGRQKFITSSDLELENSAVMAEMHARHIRIKFEAYQKVGFTERQAWILLKIDLGASDDHEHEVGDVFAPEPGHEDPAHG